MKKSLGAKTILYPTPVLVVGTYDLNGKPNVMTAAWGGICCSVPPCVAVSLRKATYSYGNIVQSQGVHDQRSLRTLRQGRRLFRHRLGQDRRQVRRRRTDAGPQRSGRCPLRAGISAGSRMPPLAHVRVGAAHAIRRRDPRREGR